MRCSILLTSLIGFFLLGAGCGSDHGNNTPDALPTDKQDAAAVNPDAAVINPPDAVADAGQDVATTGPQDAVDVPVQDAAATDTQSAAEANPQDVAGVDVQAGSEAGTGEAGASPGAMASSSLARETATLTDTEKSDLAASLSGFAFALWQGLRGDPSTKNNFVFSPTSISLALGMAYAGAQGNTASQMQSAMHVASSSDVYFRSLNWLDEQLESRADAALNQAQNLYKSSGSSGAAPDPANFRLHVVNACWGDRTFTFEQPYLDTLATDFGSGVHLADFRTQPDTERLAINAWVSQETLNRINDLIPQGAIDTTTRTVLVNAIHLKLPWHDPFLETNTKPATFTKTDGSTVSVPFMNKSGYWSYAEDDTTQAVAIPLAGSSVNFVVFLPKASSSLAAFEDSLSQGHAATLLAGIDMTWPQVSLALPKFTFTTASVRLGSVLTALGMTDAFTPNADFTGISTEKPLFISDVVHKAMVGVDEHGVEAAAATAVMLAGSGLPTEIKQVNVNRPFFFGIYDQPTSTWLFLGHVTDPSS